MGGAAPPVVDKVLPAFVLALLVADDAAGQRAHACAGKRAPTGRAAGYGGHARAAQSAQAAPLATPCWVLLMLVQPRPLATSAARRPIIRNFFITVSLRLAQPAYCAARRGAMSSYQITSMTGRSRCCGLAAYHLSTSAATSARLMPLKAFIQPFSKGERV